MVLPLVLGASQIAQGVAILGTAIVISDQLSRSLNPQPDNFGDGSNFGLPGFDTTNSIQPPISLPPENPVWDGQSTGTGALADREADSRRQSLRDSYMPAVGSPPSATAPPGTGKGTSAPGNGNQSGAPGSGRRNTAPGTINSPPSNSVSSSNAIADLAKKLANGLGNTQDLFDKSLASIFPNSIAAVLGNNPNFQKFPFGLGFDDLENGFDIDSLRVNNFPELNPPPFKGGQLPVRYKIQMKAIFLDQNLNGPFSFTREFGNILGPLIYVGRIDSVRNGRVNIDFIYITQETGPDGEGVPFFSYVPPASANQQIQNDALKFEVTILREDGQPNGGPDPAPLIPNQLPSPPPPYPPANEWPYGDVEIKVGGLPDQVNSPDKTTVKPFLQTQPPDRLEIVTNNPDISTSPSGFNSIPQVQSQVPTSPQIQSGFQSTPATQTPATQTPATQSGFQSIPATQTPATQVYVNGRTNADYLKLTVPAFNAINPPATQVYNTPSQVTPTTPTISPPQVQNTTPNTSTPNQIITELIPQISTTITNLKQRVKEAICEESAPQGCIDNSNKRNKVDSELVPVQIVEFSFCRNEQPQFTTKQIFVLKGTEQAVQGIYQQLADIEALQCNENVCYAAVPEWWQIRPEGKRPQLVLQFCAKEGQGKYGSPKYPITIPHPKITQKMMSSPLEDYKKGNFEGELKLADNSKVIVNCINKAEAERVLSIIKGMIKDKLLEGSTVKFSERGGKPVKQQEMVIRFATYFEKGIEDSANYKWKSIFDLPQ